MFLKKVCCSLAFAASALFAQEVGEAPSAPAPEAAPAAAPAESPKAEEPASVESIGDLATSKDKSSTISVFVKKPEEIKALQEDLKNLQTMAGGSNPEIDALMKKANRIAEMNDRCASISLTETLDESCGRFYEVELPAFENEFMELTGEIRLGSMHMATTLEERTRQLASCSEALTSIVVGREQLLRLRGNIYLEPINFDGDFDAEYNFTLFYDPARLEQQQRLANLWIEKCGSIVLRQSGSEFAPMFIATLKVKNDSLKKNGSNVKFMMNKKDLKLRIDMRRSMNGGYYMNGIRMFEKTLDASNAQSLLHFDIKNKKAFVDLPKDSVIEKFTGRKEFKKFNQKTEMIGRWMWDADRIAAEAAAKAASEAADAASAEIAKAAAADSAKAAIAEESKAEEAKAEAEAVAMGDEAESMTKEDSLAYQKGLEELAKAEAAAKAEEERREAAIKAKKEELAKKAAEEQAARDEQARLAAESAKEEQAAAAAADAAQGGKPVVRIIPLAISGAVVIGGSVMAAVFNNKAKTEKDKEIHSVKEYDDQLDKVQSAQTKRNIGYGLIAAGLVGVGISFVF